MSLSTARMELLRPDEILAERDRCPLVYVPIGPLEWHSLHLPYGTDPLNAEAVARAAASVTGGLVHPTLFWGTERERPAEKLINLGLEENAYVVGMDFPGNSLPSMYTREEVFSLLIREVLERLLHLKFQLVVLVNGHGGRNHIEVLKRLTAEFCSRSPGSVLLTFALPGNMNSSAGHAEAVETSIMLHLYPDSVKLENLPPLPQPIPISLGIVDSATFSGSPTPDRTLPPGCDPRLHSNPEIGQALLKQTVLEITAMVKSALAERNGVPLKP